MKKKTISFILALIMAFGLSAFAPVSAEGYYTPEAEQLKLLGVFQGTDLGFELERQPTRLEGLVMFVRLLGREAEAKELADNDCAFTDVPDWGRGYVNYAYENGLTKGVGEGRFGSSEDMNALAYTTFMLRALGYRDGEGDFTYEGAVAFAEQIGMYSAADVGELADYPFLRDNVAKVSMLALGTAISAGERTLLEKLVGDGAIAADTAAEINPDASKSVVVHFIDVGQADAILIQKGGAAMLIDGGNKADSGTVVDYIRAQGIETLDYVVATHPHEDHIGGLGAVIRTFDVKNLIMPDVVTTTVIFEDTLHAIEQKRLEIALPAYGDTYDLNGAAFTVLAPIGSAYTGLNDYSVVLKLVNGSNSFLFTGDAEKISEGEMLARDGGILKSDVLKVGHHGSESSTSAAFLAAADPAYAVISVGADNPYGLPDASVLALLQSRNIGILRTDEQGTVICTGNGRMLVFNGQPPQAAGAAPGDTPDGTASGIVIGAVDKKAEIVTLTNSGPADVDLSGWVLVSVAGNQRFAFPAVTLGASQSLTVASGGATGDLIWTSANIWNNESSDPARLYDAGGKLVSSYGDEELA